MSEQTSDKGPAVRFPPPFVPLLVLGAGMFLHWLLPLSSMTIAGSGGRYAIGGASVVAGLIFMALAIGWFRKTGQDPAPWTESQKLVLEGICKWTRNPMCPGMGLLQGGLGPLSVACGRSC